MQMLKFGCVVAGFLATALLAEHALAQTRFPGDSPTRLLDDEGRQKIPIGTPGAGRANRGQSRNTRTFVIRATEFCVAVFWSGQLWPA